MFGVRERAWSPYIAGFTIGLLLIPALLVTDTVPDPSAGFLTVAGRLVATAAPDAGQGASLSSHSGDARDWWQVALLVGIVLGALLSATVAEGRRQARSPIWNMVLGTSSPTARAVTAFAGGFLMLLGAGLAGGDLIGHGLSGVAQLALSSFTVLAALVVGGLLVGRLLKRP